MMKLDFKTISLKDSRSYIKVNRKDIQAWDIFLDRINSEATKSPLYDVPSSFEEFELILEQNPDVKAKLGRI